MFRLKRKIIRGKGYAFVDYLPSFHRKPYAEIHHSGKPITVFRRPDGTFHAWEMVCTRDGADLTRGFFSDEVVTCPRYGRRFDLETGECLTGDAPPLTEHAVRLQGYDVYVSLAPKPRTDDTSGGGENHRQEERL